MILKEKIYVIIVSIIIIGFAACISGCSNVIQDDNWEDASTGDIEEHVDPEEKIYTFDPALTSITGESMDITVPNNLTDVEGPFKNKNSIKYSNENKTANVVITAEKDKDGLVCSYSWKIEILDKSAGNKFTYSFDDNVDYTIVKAEDYDESFQGAGLYFLDSDGNELSAISEAAAYDANGKKVESHYEIIGDKVTQVVSFGADSAFPITIE